MSKTKAKNRRETGDDADASTTVFRRSAKYITFFSEEKDLGHIFEHLGQKVQAFAELFLRVDLGRNAMTTHVRFVHNSSHRDNFTLLFIVSASTNTIRDSLSLKLRICRGSNGHGIARARPCA